MNLRTKIHDQVKLRNGPDKSLFLTKALFKFSFEHFQKISLYVTVTRVWTLHDVSSDKIAFFDYLNKTVCTNKIWFKKFGFSITKLQLYKNYMLLKTRSKQNDFLSIR